MPFQQVQGQFFISLLKSASPTIFISEKLPLHSLLRRALESFWAPFSPSQPNWVSEETLQPSLTWIHGALCWISCRHFLPFNLITLDLYPGLSPHCHVVHVSKMQAELDPALLTLPKRLSLHSHISPSFSYTSKALRASLRHLPCAPYTPPHTHSLIFIFFA